VDNERFRNDDPNFDVMGNFDHGLTLALSKGRILKETLPLLETAGINYLKILINHAN
jgi:ATP phosphoribosyltransferase